VFLGYAPGKKAYRVMALDTQKFYFSRDIIFHENVFPFSQANHQSLFPNAPTSFDFDSAAVPLPSPHAPDPNLTPAPLPSPTSNLSPHSPHHPAYPVSPTRRPSRQHKPPQYLNDYVCSASNVSACFHTLTNLSIQPPNLSASCLSTTSQKFLASLDFVKPQTYD